MSADDDLSYWQKRQLSAFEENFDVVDKDKSGCLSYGEVKQLLRDNGYKGTEDDLKAIFNFVDEDNDCKVSRSEYASALQKVPRISLHEIVLRRAFKKMDKDGSGFLSRGEIIAAVSSEEPGAKLPVHKAVEMLIALITDKDQKLDYEEFLDHFRYKLMAILLRDIFNKIDTDKSGFLTKAEIQAAIEADVELSFQATNLSEILINLTEGESDKIKYEEFAEAVANQAKI